MTRRVLVLGGTTEGRALAELLSARTGTEVTTSLAGRVAEPRLPPGRTRTGGFGGPAALAAYLRAERIDAMVDATHPFAATVTRNAAAAAAQAGVPLLVLRRPGWTAGEGDRWHPADDLAHAAALVPGLGRRAFLTTGRTGLAPFAALDGLFFLIRSVDPPGPPLPAHHHVLLARGPFTAAGERALLREHRVDVLVTKDSGGAATAAKLAAARDAGLPVVVVRRPPPPPGVPTAADPAAAAAWVRRATA